MEIRTTCDAPDWSAVFDFVDEPEQMQHILDQYPDFPFDLVIGFRCLDREISGWKSKVRHYSNDKMLVLDIVTYYDDFLLVKNDINAQRKIMGTEFYSFLVSSMQKYEKKFPVLKKINPSFLPQVKQWCIENKWLDE